MATDFFDQQQAAHRQTGRLLVLFVLAVICIILSVYAAVSVIFAVSTKTPDPAQQFWNPVRLAAIATGVLAVIVSGSLYKIVMLGAGGGASVARLMGGEPVYPGSADLAERRLLNVVEEMAIASGTPVPTVYVLNDEGSINAFAAGFQSGDAVIAVSRGCLDYLTRDELQGVIGHEFSHILNGDMRLNLRLIGILHGILLIGLMGYWILRWGDTGSSRRSSDKKDGGQIMLLGIALLVIGYIGVFFGRLIKCAISRQREFLADSSSIQFTRNPAGIAGALKKIGGLAEGARIGNPNAEQACHMFFGQGVSAWSELLATHPPLAARIRRIDSSFDGTFPEVRQLSEGEQAEADQVPRRSGQEFLRRAVSTAILGGSAPLTGANELGAIPLDASAAVESVGMPTKQHVTYASELLDAFPEPLVTAAHEPFTARAVVYALLLDSDDKIRNSQLQYLEANDERGTTAEVLKLVPLLAPLGPAARIPLADLTLPALRRLSPPQYSRFRANIDPLIAADKRVSLFEFTLQRMLLRHLDQHFTKRTPARSQYLAIRGLLGDCAVVLSALARIGQKGEDEIARAFSVGASRIEVEGQGLSLLARESSSLRAVDRALDRLALASPPIKRRVLDSCAACIAADGYVTIEEGELLRAIADSLDCPMPPLLAGVSTARAGSTA